MAKKKMLIIEDDANISRLVQYSLDKAGFHAMVALTGEDGLNLLQKNTVDAIVLDLMLPGMDGLEVCKHVRQNPRTADVPIIMLTAKGEEVDRIVGFEIGADDYVVKPFSPRELVLRVKAIMKRLESATRTDNADMYTWGSLTVDTIKHIACVGKKEVELTPIEFNLLVLFLKRKGRVQTRDVLLNDVWGIDAFITTRTVDTHVKRLRQKLGKAGDYIQTVRGIGYRFSDRE